ncbi:unnamed protein product [Camellia sinensis]
MMKQETTNTPIPTPTAPVCGNCGVEEWRLLLHVRHRATLRRLCTSCVLRLHPQSFCPTCFLVFDRQPPSNDTVTCFKCYSYSHSRCVPPNSPKPYICPPCSNPNAPIFLAKKVKAEDPPDGDGDGFWREIDKKSAKVLLAAARIAANSMGKAALAAKVEAEKRAKEASFARKKAREALEHVAFLVAKEKLKRKDLLSAEVSGSGNVVTQERNQKTGTSVNSVGIGNAVVVAEQNRIGNQRARVGAGGVDGVDGPNEVSARLNAVGLREERLHVFGGRSVVSGPQNNGGVMAVDGNERPRVNSGSNVGGAFIQNKENERSGYLGHSENNNAQGEKADIGLYSVPPVGDELQHMQNNHGMEENIGSQQ